MIDEFLAFEKEEQLLDKQINDFYYWGYIRFGLYRSLLEIKDNQELIPSPKIKYKAKHLLSLIFKSISRNPMIMAEKKKILFIASSSRRIKKGKTYECIYTDNIAAEFGNDVCTAEIPYRNQHMEPVASKNILYLDFILFYSKIIRRLQKYVLKKESAYIASTSKQISDELEKKFGAKLEEKYLEDLIKKNYIYYKVRKKMIIKLLKRISPEIIIVVNGYDPNNKIINEVAKELDIKTIELQHGVIGKGHLAYNYSEKKEYPFFPDEIFLFSDYWKTTGRFPISEDKLIVTGFPHMEESVKKYQREVHKKAIINIIVLSQPLYAAKFHSIIYDLILLMDLKDIDYNLIYKLHPAEFDVQNKIWDKLDNHSRVEVVKSNKLHLYHYLSVSDIQIGMSSTALFEGLAFDLQTFIYRMPTTELYMGDLCQKGYAKMFESAPILFDKIREGATEAVTSNNEFFLENAKDNIISEIKKRLN